MYRTCQRSAKALLIVKWKKYFASFLHHTVGERNILLSYVIHESDTVPVAIPPIMRGKPYSEEHGYVDT